MENEFLKKLEEEFVYCVAPLEDVSDNAFRTTCYNNGADITFTEMTRVEGLAKKNASTWSRLKFQDSTPTIIQLLVGKGANLEKFLSEFKSFPGFMGFNLNLGCPSPDVIGIGQGCAMIKRVSKINKFIKIIKDAGYPVSLKIRLGLNAYEKRKKAYLNLITGTNADFFIVHARHGTQKYVDPADFSVYADCVATGKIIIANGDISTSDQVDDLKKLGIKGVMIGRKAVSNPAIFNELKGNDVKPILDIKKDYLVLAKKYSNQQKYSVNVLKRLNSKSDVDKDRLI